MTKASKSLQFILATLIMLWCNGCLQKTKQVTTSNFHKTISNSIDYLSGWDLDGDDTYDDISFHYSGGAHCCYYIEIRLSSNNFNQKYPFEMDGGYLMGVDDSQPHRFNIKDYDRDGLPEIFMEIATYNGELLPVEKSWTKEFGIQTNYVLFDFLNDSLIVKDYLIKNK